MSCRFQVQLRWRMCPLLEQWLKRRTTIGTLQLLAFLQLLNSVSKHRSRPKKYRLLLHHLCTRRMCLRRCSSSQPQPETSAGPIAGLLKTVAPVVIASN